MTQTSSISNETSALKGLRTPKPLLSKSQENLLSNRQKDAVAGLEDLIKDGYPKFTMSEIASKLKVSLRTLYEIAPKKDALLLIAVDRLLFKIGAKAQKAIIKTDSPITKLQLFLKETNEATLNNALAFTEDFNEVKGGKELIDSHENFCVDICEGFLKDAIKIKEIDIAYPRAMAITLSGFTRERNKRYSKEESLLIQSDDIKEFWDVIFRGLKNN